MNVTTTNEGSTLGRHVATWTVAVLMVWMINTPEDFKVGQFGTASILPPAIISTGKMLTRLTALGLLGFYLVQMLPTTQLTRAIRIQLPLLMFAIWSVSSTTWSALKGTTLSQSVTFVLLMLLALAIGLSYRTEKDASRLLKVYSVAAVLTGIGLLLLHFAVPKYGALTRESSGIFHSTSAGATASLSIVILVLSNLLWRWQWARSLLFPGICIHIAVLLVGANRLSMALTLAVCGVAVMLFTNKAVSAWLGLLGGLCGAICLIVDARMLGLRTVFSGLGTVISQGQTTQNIRSFSGRLEMWEVIWDSYLESPLMGHGYFVTSETGRIFVWDEWGNWTAHNWLLQLMATTGFVGTALMLWGLGLLVYLSVQRRNADPSMAAFVLMLGSWFLGWGMLNSSFLGPLMPESVVFAMTVGFATALAMPPLTNQELG